MLTVEDVYGRLRTVFDPETNLNIVEMGLVYDVRVLPKGKGQRVNILYTLTTPGCPLMGALQKMMQDALKDVPGFNPDQDLELELTFDPPWTAEMLSEGARAELGL